MGMETTAQNPNSQNPNSNVGGNTTQQQTQQPSQPVSVPVGGKETVAMSQTTEFIAPSTPEIAPKPEVSEYMKVTPVVPPLSQDAQQAGVAHAKEATPVHTSETASLNLQTPHPTIQTMMGIHKNVKDGITWLLRLINREQEKQLEQKKEDK